MLWRLSPRFAFLSLALLSLLGPGLPVWACFGAVLCWPTLTALGLGSAVIGFTLASWLYGEGYLVVPDVW